MGSSINRFSKQTRHQITALSALLITGVFSVSGAAAQDFYISGTLGLNNPQDSSNSGRLNAPFTTPAVPGFSSMGLAEGTPFSWNTDFSNGETYAVAFGYNYDPFRVELALQRSSSNVDKHSNFNLANMDISAANAGILGAGVTGTSVEGFISPDGRMESTSVMLNVYYDFDWQGDIDPYVGIGIGNAEEEVVFSSANGGIVNGQENDFAWQLIAGFQYQVDNSVSFFGQYRYFNANDPDFRTTLFPGTVGVENQYQAIEFGLRFSF
jgi:opacity protein-like surface antigen